MFRSRFEMTRAPRRRLQGLAQNPEPDRHESSEIELVAVADRLHVDALPVLVGAALGAQVLENRIAIAEEDARVPGRNQRYVEGDVAGRITPEDELCLLDLDFWAPLHGDEHARARTAPGLSGRGPDQRHPRRDRSGVSRECPLEDLARR